jgi:signal transduction histidine kinase
VRGDSTQLAEVTSNLIANAIRYNKRGGHVDISLSQVNGNAVLRVADDGVGIPDAALPFVFDRFFQVDPARSRASGGAGLGLALAQRIVKAHRGAITVESRLGVGSTFTVTLPAQRFGGLQGSP